MIKYCLQLRGWLMLMILLLGFSDSYSQTVYVMGASAGTNGATVNALNATTVTVNCGASNIFRDSGGSGANYANNENITVTFCSSTSAPLFFDFRATTASLNLDAGSGDSLFFYDAGTGSLITVLTQSDDYAFSEPTVGTVSSCVRVVWKSNGANVDGGWDGTISCINPPTCATNVPAADMFGQAPSICNLNSYCGVTSSYYGEDAPYNFAGTGGGCPAPDGLFGGTLQNNSWLKFEALSTTAVFNFTISGGGSCNGVQAGIFAFNSTTKTFTLKSPCASTNGTGLAPGTSTLTATGLTVGQTYYLMMDGNAGSVCDYTIGVNSGVAVSNAGPDQTVCGTTATMAAVAPAISGTWTVVSGSATFSNANSATTSVSGLSNGANVLRWSTSTNLCGDVSDEVTITSTVCLPVEAVNISAGCFDHTPVISWATLSETNSDYFRIEKLNSEGVFVTLKDIPAAGYSNSLKQYRFTDDGAKSEGVYRISQADRNATVHFYEPIILKGGCGDDKEEMILVSPNPFDHLVTVRLSESLMNENTQVLLQDAMGTIYGQATSDFSDGLSGAVSFETAGLPRGLYFIKVLSGNEVFVKKIVK